VSYILDALHKADRERAGDSGRSTEQFMQPTTQTVLPRADRRNAILVLAVLVLLVASGWLAWQLLNAVQVPPSALRPEVPTVAAPLSQPARQPAPMLTVTIAGHLFVAPGHTANKLFTNHGVLRVGGALPSGWLLLAIDEREAVFAWQGQQQSVVLR